MLVAVGKCGYIAANKKTSGRPGRAPWGSHAKREWACRSSQRVGFGAALFCGAQPHFVHSDCRFKRVFAVASRLPLSCLEPASYFARGATFLLGCYKAPDMTADAGNWTSPDRFGFARS